MTLTLEGAQAGGFALPSYTITGERPYSRYPSGGVRRRPPCRASAVFGTITDSDRHSAEVERLDVVDIELTIASSSQLCRTDRGKPPLALPEGRLNALSRLQYQL